MSIKGGEPGEDHDSLILATPKEDGAHPQAQQQGPGACPLPSTSPGHALPGSHCPAIPALLAPRAWTQPSLAHSCWTSNMALPPSPGYSHLCSRSRSPLPFADEETEAQQGEKPPGQDHTAGKGNSGGHQRTSPSVCLTGLWASTCRPAETAGFHVGGGHWGLTQHLTFFCPTEQKGPRRLGRLPAYLSQAGLGGLSLTLQAWGLPRADLSVCPF